MRAAFRKIDITPSIGTRMSGFGRRDDTGPCQSIHDRLYARLLYLEHEGEEAVIIGFDLLFFSRANSAWLKDALCTRLSLKPSQVLLNTSHTHAGPCVDVWHTNLFQPTDTGYMQSLVRAVTLGAEQARSDAREVTLSAGTGQSRLPVNRRMPDGRGGIDWLPNFEGEVCRNLPVCLFTDRRGQPVCLLFSASCHPSIIGDRSISADYPGPACDQIDANFGVDCSLFLQGAAGDSKPSVVANGSDDNQPGVKTWRFGTWDDVAAAARIVADEVIDVIKAGLAPGSPSLSTSIHETSFALETSPDAAALEERTHSDNRGRATISRFMLEQLEKGRQFETSADLLVQGIRLADSVRIIAIEAEVVAELGNKILATFQEGTTFALGYSNGTGLYLPSDRMLPEGGYEVICHHEYGFASPLVPGIDDTLMKAVQRLRTDGIR